MTTVPPRLNITVRVDGRAVPDPADCPTCGQEIREVQPPPRPTPAEQERAVYAIPPPRYFTVEPCGHDVALFLTVEEQP